MFIHKEKSISGYRFKDKTWYTKQHLGVDWGSNFDSLYAPTDGEVILTTSGIQGGNWLHFKDSFGLIHRFGHLKEFIKLKGAKVKKGYLLAISGNSGALTTGPHTHHDISINGKVDIKDINNFYNPELYFMPKKISVKIVTYNSRWIDKKIKEVTDWFYKETGLMVILDITVEHINKPKITWNKQKVKNYKDFVDPNYDMTVLCMPTADWKAKKYENIEGYADIDVKPYFIAMNSNEKSTWWKRDKFTSLLKHEICHVLHTIYGVVDSTHFYDLKQNDLAKCFQHFTFVNPPKENLTTGTSLSSGILIKNKNNPAVYYVGKEKIAWIKNEKSFEFGRDNGWWGDWKDVKTIDTTIIHDIIF